MLCPCCRFQPTLPARGATGGALIDSRPAAISTHAPRTGSDAARFPRDWERREISTHAPRTGSDCSQACRGTFRRNFNPRSPHGERQCQPDCHARCVRFQPTLPARGATTHSRKQVARELFQPTLPARGATAATCTASQASRISTHAPRTGSDAEYCISDADTWRFQPTLPARGATNKAPDRKR